jgi:hypothetical protein
MRGYHGRGSGFFHCIQYIATTYLAKATIFGPRFGPRRRGLSHIKPAGHAAQLIPILCHSFVRLKMVQ